MGIMENPTAARGCNPPVMVISSQSYSFNQVDNIPPVVIPIIVAFFDLASLNEDRVSSVLPE